MTRERAYRLPKWWAFRLWKGVTPPSGKVIVLSAVVRGEDDNRIVQFAHVLELLQDDADVVVHLLHAGFVDAPIFAARLTHHGHHT